MKKSILFSSFLFLLLANCLYGQSNWKSKVDSLLSPYTIPNSPGLSIGIVQNGKLTYSKGIGLANLEYDIPNSGTSKFGVASIAKQFTAACIWSLIRQNKLSLDADIRKYLPELPFYGDTIRIMNMLNHTNGLRNYHSIMDLAGFDYDKSYYDNQSVLEIACKQKNLNHLPNEKVLYGNTAYTLLAIVIERIAGQKLNDYAKEHIFTPLGMNNTLFRVENNSIIKNRAVGYVQNDDLSYSQFPKIQCSYGAGSLATTVEDLAKWASIFQQQATHYQDLANFLMTQDTLLSGEIASYARGVMVDTYKGKQTVHHSGYALGSQSQLISIPSMQLSVIILTNLESINPTPLSYKILDLFIANQSREKLPIEPYKHQVKDLEALVGAYKEINSDMKMEILLENDTLKSKGSQGKKFVPLVASGKNRFYRFNSENVKYEFSNTKDKEYDLVIYFGGTPFYFRRASFIEANQILIKDFTGVFYSNELDITYHFFEEKDNLYLSYPNNTRIKLFAGQKDEFGNENRVLYSFQRNAQNEVIAFRIASEGTVKDIEFIKVVEKKE